MKWFGAVGVLLLVSLSWGQPPRYTLLDYAEVSDLAFFGTVKRVDQDTATIEVDKMIAGKEGGKVVVVTPNTIPSDWGARITQFEVGEKVFIFAKTKEAGVVNVVMDGFGKTVLYDAPREAQIAAVARLMQIAAMKEEDARNLALLAEATSDNVQLRREALEYISTKIGRGPLRDQYRKQLVALLDNKDPEVQRAGLDGLRNVRAEETLPRMIELTRSAATAENASQALAQYNTAESAAALIALLQNPRWDIRSRAVLDLGGGHSQRPEVKAAFVALMADKDERIRSLVPYALVRYVRDDVGILPKIADMLNDPNINVSCGAARALGSTRNADAIGPLLDVLERGTSPGGLKREAMDALHTLFAQGGPAGKAAIEKRLNVIIDNVRNDKENSATGLGWHGVWILTLCDLPEAKAALRSAAETHPNADVRNQAKKAMK